jgi:spermidine synthase
MEFWFTERQTSDLGLTFRVKESLWVERTPYQTLAILDTYQYGRMLVLDGAVQTTEVDEHIYHEMLTHVPLLLHPRPRRVLVVGGGDGGTVREALKHPEVELVELVEIDERVIAAAKRFLPTISCALEDPRARVIVGDGVAQVAAARGTYDVILVDSTDPVGPAIALFEEPFFASLHRALKTDGLFAAQTKTPYLDGTLIGQIQHWVAKRFPVARLYTAAIPTYPTGLWSFMLGSKRHPHDRPDEVRAKALETKYYTPQVHRAAFALPRAVEEALERAGGALP